jgi:hypothetical protein
MKKFFYLFAFAVLFTITANAQWGYHFDGKISVGKMPVRTFVTNIGFVVYCAGYDANFNGQQDEGDEPPSLWVLSDDGDGINGAEKLIDLDFRTPAVPARFYFEPVKNILFVSNTNSIDTISFYFDGEESKAKKGKYIDNIGNVTGISGGLTHLFLSVRKTLNEGFVYTFDMENGKFTDTIKAGVGVQMNEFQLMTDQLLILNEGTFGKDDGSLQVTNIENGEAGTVNEVAIGGTPNFFLVDLHSLKTYVVCNSSNNIITFDFQANRDTFHFDLPQYNGPREISIFPVSEGGDTYYALTTYDSKVIIFDKNGDSLYTYDAYGKAESLFFLGEQFLILTPFKAGSYEASNEITVYSKSETSVADSDIGTWEIRPNPAKDYFYLSSPENVEIQSADLINSLGQKVYSFNGSDFNYFHINTNLPAGLYFVRIKSKNSINTLPVILK